MRQNVKVVVIQIDKLEKEVDDQVSSGLLFADAVSQSSVQSLDESTPSILEQSEVRHPVVPVCYAEDIVAQGIAANREAIVDVTSSMHSNYNSFIKSVQGQLEETEKKLEARAYDKTNLGKVVKISDEEEDDLPIGGTNYYS